MNRCPLYYESMKIWELSIMMEQLSCVKNIQELQRREYGMWTVPVISKYVHCYAHVLNLCLVDESSTVTSVRNMIGVLNELQTYIVVSSKRHSAFENIPKNRENTASWSRSTTIKPLSDARLNYRLEAISSVLLNIRLNLHIIFFEYFGIKVFCYY